MKKLIVLFTASFVIALNACAKPKLVDLSKYEMPLKIAAPKKAKIKNEFGAITIQKGKGFNLTINQYKSDISKLEAEIKANDINQLQKFHQKTDDTLVYESAVIPGRAEFHFYHLKKIGDKEYTIENTKGPTYTKAQCINMLRAAQSLKAK